MKWKRGVNQMTKRTIRQYNPKLKERARQLRKNMTEPEVILWQYLRKKQIWNQQFYRQRPIGQFIIDFYAPDVNLVIEVDGGRHYTEEGLEYDMKRDAYLKSQQLRVLRFTNSDVYNNLEGVLKAIQYEVKALLHEE